MTHKLPLADITPFTMLDYPDHTACIIWFAGCNFRCAYCHNPELIHGTKSKISREQVFSFLRKRAGLLDAVVISGGECTLTPGLPEFVQQIKTMGFKVKIDTNGSKPEQLHRLLEEQCVDYIALDYKAPLYKLAEISGCDIVNEFELSLDLLCHSNVTLEIRTTVHSDLLNENDISLIQQDLQQRGFKGNYYVQNFRQGQTLGDLPEQQQSLETVHWLQPKSFTTGLRNF